MNLQQQDLSGWANFPVEKKALVYSPDALQSDTYTGIRDYLRENEQVTIRGNGRSYGDAALGNAVISTLSLNQIIHFDALKGIVTCEAGVLLADLLPRILPSGWFLEVTPGTQYITLGGAIACDVHGKNHPTAGCFSNTVLSFRLMLASGEVVNCSRSENADLFWLTCGGMGWTGVILSTVIRLRRVGSDQMQQQTHQLQKAEIGDFLRIFEANKAQPYAAAWLDFSVKHLRGTVFLADHAPESTSSKSPTAQHKRHIRVPFFAPNGLLNAWTIRIYNEMYYRKNPSGRSTVSMAEYFYPLDKIEYWNRLYGRRGFVQYQFCLPQAAAESGLHAVWELVRNSGETPFLTVLKRHGEAHPQAQNSFPIAGYSLALDFPRTRGIAALVERLDDLIWPLGGKIYLAKDALSATQMSRVAVNHFEGNRFTSRQKQRLSPT